jgi:hypothetical protein
VSAIHLGPIGGVRVGVWKAARAVVSQPTSPDSGAAGAWATTKRQASRSRATERRRRTPAAHQRTWPPGDEPQNLAPGTATWRCARTTGGGKWAKAHPAGVPASVRCHGHHRRNHHHRGHHGGGGHHRPRLRHLDPRRPCSARVDEGQGQNVTEEVDGSG